MIEQINIGLGFDISNGKVCNIAHNNSLYKTTNTMTCAGSTKDKCEQACIEGLIYGTNNKYRSEPVTKNGVTVCVGLEKI